MTRQREIGEWVLRVFGPAFWNRTERALRVCEEAIEVGQAFGLNKEVLHKLVDYVFDRPVRS